MHPEVLESSPGACPKCGMALVEKEEALEIKTPAVDRGLGVITWQSYMPLIVIFALLLVSVVVLGLRDLALGTFSSLMLVSYFMTGFFLVFGGFKFMDLKGFAEGYATYDLLAKKWYAYGYVYPFIEVLFGLLMLYGYVSRGLLWVEFIVMLFSGIGVAKKLLRKEQFMCACLGTFLKVPLTYITLIEDFGMALLALLLILVA